MKTFKLAKLEKKIEKIKKEIKRARIIRNEQRAITERMKWDRYIWGLEKAIKILEED